ncbi:MAG TPA: hypothetical protein VI704_00510, partial [Bacteroidota bacterium]|nr:hypothetical protein [Bacteroidota bacterium]
LLAAEGHKNVFTLRGGLNEWNDKILFPSVSGEMTAKERERIMERAVFFGGELRTATSKTAPTRRPSVTPNTKVQKNQEKQREIC